MLQCTFYYKLWKTPKKPLFAWVIVVNFFIKLKFKTNESLDLFTELQENNNIKPIRKKTFIFLTKNTS